MKPFLLILGLVLAAGAGAVGGTLVAPNATAKSTEALPAPAPLQPAVAITPEVQKRMDALSMEIATLESQIAALRDDKARVPATAPAAPAAAPEQVAFQRDSTEAFAATHREAILKVIADEKAEQDRKREEARKLAQEQQDVQKADRAAVKFGLTDAQKRQLTDYYGTERQKFEDMRTAFRDRTADGTAPENPRDAFREARDWRSNELTRLFGTDLGAQIGEFENERQRGGGNGLAGGQGQGQGGGGGRRQGGGGNGNGNGAGNAGGNQPGAGPTAPRAGGGR